MTNRKKSPITLRSIKHLWERTGRRPVEVPLITKQLIDEITSQPRQYDATPFLVPTSTQPYPRRRWIWAAAASVLLLFGALSLWQLGRVGYDERLVAVRVEPISELDEEAPSKMKDRQAPEEKRQVAQTDVRQHAPMEEYHHWQTAEELPLSIAEEHENGGMVCYSRGQIAEDCDEEMVTRMLLAFL